MSQIERRLRQLGLELPEAASPAGAYVACVRTGSWLMVSGQIPFRPDGSVIAGKVGVDVSVEDAKQAARLAGLSLVAAARQELTSLDEVERVVRIGGFVNAEPTFSRQPEVINGCSELMLEIWGERGRHVRAAVGVGSLPANAVVEVDGIFELRR